MSRAVTGDVVTLKPTNNVYTVLVVVATLVAVIGLIIVISQYHALFNTQIWSG